MHKFNIADRNYHIIDDCGQFIEVMIVRAQQCQDYIGEFIMQDNTSAKAWILMDATKEFYIRGCNTQEKREIASITKMYTLYACLTLNKHFGIAPETTFLEVLPSVVSGTLANLVPNEYISIMDLYYGMMLPSGNDAACVLAFFYGSWLVTKKSYQGFPKSHKKENVGDKMKHYQLYTKKFVQFMNNFIVKQDLRHSHTHFENCHGLPDKDQVSTAWQLAQASLKFIKNPLFSHICSSKIHRGNYYESDYSFQWKNTNILLNEGYKGIKTGFTNSAGGCLSSLTSIPIDKYSRQQLLIIVLGSKDSDSRFRDTKIVVEDYKRYLNMMRL